MNMLIPPWVKALIIGGLLSALAIFSYKLGAKNERADWQSSQNLALIAAAEETSKLEAANRKLERDMASQAAQLSTLYKGQLNEKLTEKDHIIANLRAGHQRLSIQTRGSAACTSADSRQPANRRVAATTPRAELSDTAGEFLVGLASEADEVVLESNHIKDLLAQCRAQNQQQQTIRTGHGD